MRIPTLHLNGSGYEALVAELDATIRRLQEAEDALGVIFPNGRDYPQGESAIGEAISEHVARVAAIQKVKRELSEIRQDLRSQRAGRLRRRDEPIPPECET